MTEEKPFPDLFELGRQSLEQFKKEFASYGIECDPEMGLHKGAGMLCYYDFNDRQIYLSMPDLKAPTGKLQMLMFRQMICAETNEELMRFLAIFIPFVVSHEMTHHFRHRYGLFGEDSWQEEQLANKMATAVNKHRIPPEEKIFAVNFLERAMKKLGAQIGIGEDAFDSYYDIAHALNTADHISNEELSSLRLAQGLASSNSASASSTMMLRRSGALSDELKERLEKRKELISSFNQQYASDTARYIYYQIGWVYLAMKSHESSYVAEFARKHLNMSQASLAIGIPETYKSRAIYACYQAAQETKPASATLSRYFYKRYRAFLIDYLIKNHQAALQGMVDPDELNYDFISDWDDRVTDPLNFMIGMTSPLVREIFPSRIAYSSILRDIHLPGDLPTPEDQQLWDSQTTPAPDPTRNLLHILEQFDTLEIFRPLPPETILELAQHFYEVRYETGETLVWLNESNNDVFVLLDGQLETILQHGKTNLLIKPGEVFGEIAWLTKSTRAATVRATQPSRCLVIKENNLRLLCYKNPGILLAIAASTAQRFKDSQVS